MSNKRILGPDRTNAMLKKNSVNFRAYPTITFTQNSAYTNTLDLNYDPRKHPLTKK